MINVSISPIAFLGIRWYGIMIAIGIMSIVLWMLWEARRGARFSNDTVLTAALIGIPSGIVLSKVAHIIDFIVVARLHPELVQSGDVIDYLHHPGQMFSAAGLTAYGAVLGATFGIWVYSRFSKGFRFGYFADLAAPAIILAQAIGRVGCLINGCCYGKITSFPVALVYRNPLSYAPLNEPTHAAVLYEIVYNLIVLGVLLKLRKRLKPEGSLFMVYLSLYAVWRVGIDFLRAGNPFLFGLHEAQIVSIIILLITVPQLVRRTRWVKAGGAGEEPLLQAGAESR